MLTSQTIFFTAVAITVASGTGAMSIVLFGDTRRNLGQRNVAETLAQIALLGAAAIMSLVPV